MQKNKVFKIALISALTGICIAGCSKPKSKPAKAGATTETAADSTAAALAQQNLPFDVKEGKRLFSHYCSVCHGETGDGTGQYYGSGLQPQPANFTDKAFMKTLSDETMAKSISEGPASVGKSKMCPPWGKTFKSEEIDCLVAYIKTFSKN